MKRSISHNKNQTAFGYLTKRFICKDNKVPGPGEYKPEQSVMTLDNKKNEI